MPDSVSLCTDRLRLREWRESDLEPFARLNADPEVMEFFPSTRNRIESDQMVHRIRARFAERGWDVWAVEVKSGQLKHGIHLPNPLQTIDTKCNDDKPDRSRSKTMNSQPVFIGFVGLSVPQFEAHFTPCVEVGWRLARFAWGYGFATEAAKAAINFAFDQLNLDQVVSFTAVNNERSRRVMQRLGMTHDPREDFDHPALPVGDRLSRHVLYRLRNPAGGRRLK